MISKDGVPPPLAFLVVFLHMFLGPAWFCIKPHTMIFHVFSYSAKELSNALLI
jgi:hypothetical protein